MYFIYGLGHTTPIKINRFKKMTKNAKKWQGHRNSEANYSEPRI